MALKNPMLQNPSDDQGQKLMSYEELSKIIVENKHVNMGNTWDDPVLYGAGRNYCSSARPLSDFVSYSDSKPSKKDDYFVLATRPDKYEQINTWIKRTKQQKQFIKEIRVDKYLTKEERQQKIARCKEIIENHKQSIIKQIMFLKGIKKTEATKIYNELLKTNKTFKQETKGNEKMAVSIKQEKKHANAAQEKFEGNARIYQMHTDHFNSLKNFNETVARAVVANPSYIARFLSECPYLLHAALIALSATGVNKFDILSRMGDKDYDHLSKLVSMLKKSSKPNKEELNSEIASLQDAISIPSDDIMVLLMRPRRPDYEFRIASCNIGLMVYEFWDDAIKELDELASFERAPKAVEKTEEKPVEPVAPAVVVKPAAPIIAEKPVEPVAPVAAEKPAEFLSMSELAKRLGLSRLDLSAKKCLLMKNSDDATRAEIESMFIKSGNSKKFKAECFEKLSKLLANMGSTKPAKIQKEPVVVKNKPDTEFEIAGAWFPKPKSHVTLSDLQALKEYVDHLKQWCKNVQTSLDKSNKAYGDALKAAGQEQNADKREKLLKKAMAANADVSKYQKEIGEISEDLKKASNLLQIKNNLLKATQLLDAKIIEFMDKYRI